MRSPSTIWVIYTTAWGGTARLKTSIQIRESIFEPNDVRLSFPIVNLGLEAEEQFQRVIEIARRASAPLQEAIALDNLGYLFWAQGRLADAEKLHWLALELEEKAPNANPAGARDYS